MAKFEMRKPPEPPVAKQAGTTLYGDEMTRLEHYARTQGVSISAMIRQMCVHCLDELGVVAPPPQPAAANAPGRPMAEDAA